jgi:hypothetical protein
MWGHSKEEIKKVRALGFRVVQNYADGWEDEVQDDDEWVD